VGEETAMVEMAMVKGVRFIVQGGFMNVAVARTTGLACAARLR